MSDVNLILSLQHPQIEDQQLQAKTLQLLDQIRRDGEVESVAPVEDGGIPEGAKAIGGVILGKLRALVTLANLQRLIQVIKNFLVSNPQVEVDLDFNGQKFKAKAGNVEDLDRLMRTAAEVFPRS